MFYRNSKISSILSIGLLSLGLAACGDDGGDDGPVQADAATGGNPDSGGGTGADAATGSGITVTTVQNGNFAFPVSVLWDSANSVWYVSNFGQPLGGAEVPGWITRLAEDGTVMDEKWAEGLGNPAGMAILDGRLYVADGATISSINTADPTDVDTISVNQVGAMEFLNDVAAGAGEIYISNTLGDAIYMFTPGMGGAQGDEFLASEALSGPNGLLVEADSLVVASIGPGGADNVTGPIQKVLLADTSMIAPVGTVMGRFDGIEAHPDGGYLVTDFRGQVLAVDADGASEVVIDLVADEGLMSTADLGVNPESRMVVVPDLLGSQVVLFTLP